MKNDRDGRLVCEGQSVILLETPAGLLNGLLLSDQEAIREAVGQTVAFVGFDAHDNAELEFTDANSHLHTIWVSCSLLRVVH
jgi:hypothetical protein